MTPELLEEQARIGFQEIVEAVKVGKCNLFLGAAVHAGPPEGDATYQYSPAVRPPIGAQLSRLLATECEFRDRFKGDDVDNLQRVAQAYEAQRGRDALINVVRREVHTGKEPSSAVRALASLNFPVVITTNYDKLFETALGLAGKRHFLSVYKPLRFRKADSPAWNDPATEKRPLLFKIHGDIEIPDSIVITDEDYVNFIVRMREDRETSPVPQRVQTSLMERPTLFIGYSLKDYNLRILLKTLRAGLDGTEFPPSYSVDRKPDPLIWEFWYNRSKPKYVNFVARDIWRFVPDLYRQVMNRDMPP